MFSPLEAFVPDPDQARELLRRELSRAEYQPSLIERVQRALDRLLSDAADAAGSLGGPGWPVLTLIAILLAVALAVVLARLQRNPAAQEPARLFDEVRRSAEEHRRTARAALAEEDWDLVVVEGMRAIAAGLVERDLVPDVPATTAREVAGLASARFPDLAPRIDEAALAFDETRYGGRSASREQAQAVLALDHDLVASTPHSPTNGPVVAVPR